MNRRRYLHQLAVLGLGATAAPILRAEDPVPSGASSAGDPAKRELAGSSAQSAAKPSHAASFAGGAAEPGRAALQTATTADPVHPVAHADRAGATARVSGGSDIIVARFGGRAGRLPAPENIRRVFAAGPPAGVLVAVLAPEKLLGWPYMPSREGLALLGPKLRALPLTGRIAGRGSTVPLEALLELAPDLVLDAGTADATYVSGMQRVSEQTGLPTALIQGRMAEHAAQLREVGALLCVAGRGRQLAAEAQHVLDLAARVRESIPASRRPRVYYGRGADGLETGRPGSINVELLEFCAGHNVAADMKQGSLSRVSPEQLLLWNPEVIVTQDAGFARRVRTDPLWRDISAVRTGRIHCAPSLPFGWLDSPPSVNRLIGVRWLLEKLHPGHPALRALVPMTEATQRFYRLFYGASLSVQEVKRLLG